MAPDLTARLVDAAVAVIRDSAEELTHLDQAIGDGDHGLNMKRGFDAVADTPEIRALPLGDALQKLGMTLVMKVGGASGPLYGSLFMAMGKSVTGNPTGCDQVSAMLAEGIAAVKKRGKSEAGEKTMLDVLVPVSQVLQQAAGQPIVVSELLSRVRAAADAGLEATRNIQATKGRASFLGPRSVGHLDPGARSSQLLIHAVCGVIAGAIKS
jgi:phosphoenolpyruvate---glycerone phosphotransferase subunit DhaL